MRTIWQSLAWKEWHEHKWKLAAITPVLVGIAVVVLVTSERDTFEAAFAWVMVALLPLAIFVGASEAAGERARGTLPFLQALPVPLQRAALYKLGFGLMTIVLPVVIAVLLVWVSMAVFDLPHSDAFVIRGFAHVFSVGDPIFDAAILLTLIGVSLVIWSAAAGVRRPDEVSASAMALAVIFGCWALLIAAVASGLATVDWVRATALAAAPGGIATIGNRLHYSAPLLLVASGTHVALAAVYVRRFGAGQERAVASLSPAVVEAGEFRLAAPRRSPLSAIVWKQGRESLPIVSVGLAGAAATVTILTLIMQLGAGGIPIEDVGHMVLMASIIFGVVVSIVAGVGAFLHDEAGKLGSFWRSRPIGPDLWFATKFVAGLMIVLAAFQLPILIVYVMSAPTQIEDTQYRQAAAVLVQIALYSTAAAATCLVRQAIYATILSLSAVVCGWYGWLLVARMIGGAELVDSAPPLWLLASGLLPIAAVAVVIGWLAVRNNWSWNPES